MCETQERSERSHRDNKKKFFGKWVHDDYEAFDTWLRKGAFCMHTSYTEVRVIENVSNRRRCARYKKMRDEHNKDLCKLSTRNRGIHINFETGM